MTMRPLDPTAMNTVSAHKSTILQIIDVWKMHKRGGVAEGNSKDGYWDIRARMGGGSYFLCVFVHVRYIQKKVK